MSINHCLHLITLLYVDIVSESASADDLNHILLFRWSKKTGFHDIGFGREKTAYLYFAVSASSCLPHDSIVRLLVAKSAIIITVADDFYDVEGSLNELKLLTEAVQRYLCETYTLL